MHQLCSEKCFRAPPVWEMPGLLGNRSKKQTSFNSSKSRTWVKTNFMPVFDCTSFSAARLNHSNVLGKTWWYLLESLLLGWTPRKRKVNIRILSRKYYFSFSSCHGFVILCCDWSDIYNPEQGNMLQISYIKNIKTCPHAFSRAGFGSLAWLAPQIFGGRVISWKLIFAALSTNFNRKTFCRSVDRNFAARHQTSWLGSHYVVAGQRVVSDGLENEFALFRTKLTQLFPFARFSLKLCPRLNNRD